MNRHEPLRNEYDSLDERVLFIQQRHFVLTSLRKMREENNKKNRGVCFDFLKLVA